MPWKWPSGRSCPAANPGNELPRREPIAAAPTTSKPAERAREGRAGCQLLLSSAARLAIADLRFAAWFLWMTPLLAALSRLAHAVRMASVASATSPASAASRNLRTAVFSDDLTALLRWRAFSFCLLRLIWDLMFATRKPRSGSGLVGWARARVRTRGSATHLSGAHTFRRGRISQPTDLPQTGRPAAAHRCRCRPRQTRLFTASAGTD